MKELCFSINDLYIKSEIYHLSVKLTGQKCHEIFVTFVYFFCVLKLKYLNENMKIDPWRSVLYDFTPRGEICTVFVVAQIQT